MVLASLASGHLYDNCLGGSADNGYAYANAYIEVGIFDANTGIEVGSHVRLVWSEGKYYNSTPTIPYPNGVAWLANESMQNQIIGSSFTLGSSTSGTYYVFAGVDVLTAASMFSGGRGDSWACADGYTTASSCSGVVTGNSGGWNLNQVTVQ